MTDSMIESDIRSMREDIASLSEMQEIHSVSIDEAVNCSLFTRNSMSSINAAIDYHDELLGELRRQLRNWQTLVLVMAGWMAVATVLWAIGVI